MRQAYTEQNVALANRGSPCRTTKTKAGRNGSCPKRPMQHSKLLQAGKSYLPAIMMNLVLAIAVNFVKRLRRMSGHNQSQHIDIRRNF